jgi:hypothetical protein
MLCVQRWEVEQRNAEYADETERLAEASRARQRQRKNRQGNRPKTLKLIDGGKKDEGTETETLKGEFNA